MVSFIDAHREDCGVEPTCRVLPIAPSTYFEHKARELFRNARETVEITYLNEEGTEE